MSQTATVSGKNSRISQSHLLSCTGDAYNWDFREDDDQYFTQPGLLFNLMDDNQKEVLFANTARAMGDAPKEIKIRHIGHCYKADPAYGEGVANALGIPMSEVISTSEVK